MTEKIKQIFNNFFKKPSEKSRKELEKEVEEGTNKAVREYREVFEKLAEYDRS